MPGPLAGIKVIDFSAVVAGPFASMILADQGADVVTVEAPDRPDLLRKEWFYRGGLTSFFVNCNRGKRSIVIDLQSEQGLEVAYALCKDADVVLVKVDQRGDAACHTGRRSCFYRVRAGDDWKDVGVQVFDPDEVYGKK